MINTGRQCVNNLWGTKFRYRYFNEEIKIYFDKNGMFYGQNTTMCSFRKFKKRWFERAFKLINIVSQDLLQKTIIMSNGL